MNTQQIQKLLNADLVCNRLFQGVFSSDTLPFHPRLLISNTDPSYKPGTHWIAIYVDGSGCGEYFDSFGRPPDKHFECYMNTHRRKWNFNRVQLQSMISSFCGFYCCLFCLLRSRSLNMIGFVNMFTNDTGFNDLIVHSFICNKILN